MKKPKRFWTHTSPRHLKVKSKWIRECDLCGTHVEASPQQSPVLCSSSCKRAFARVPYVMRNGAPVIEMEEPE